MRLRLSAIEFDTSIQCRAVIDTAVINDYAERMTEGDNFPPIVVFGSDDKCWIGDGWHRALAAKSLDEEAIEATLTPGGRADALKYALGANVIHGQRRSNADKRRCVEIALREFPQMSSRGVATMCGVSHMLVNDARPRQVEESSTSPERTGQDGKTYPARRPVQEPDVKLEISVDASGAIRSIQPYDANKTAPAARRVLGPPADGMQFARMAIMDLEQIRPNDVERDEAFERVLAWISENWTRRD